MKKADKRIQRTRRGLVTAFSDLVRERGYDSITIGDIADRAETGRSTFYEHFGCKDDVLRQSMTQLFAVLADAIGETHPPKRLALVVDHFWENRHFAVPMFSGSARQPMLQVLADLIQIRLAAISRPNPGVRPLLPLHVVAEQLAQSQLSLISAWLDGKARSTPEVIAWAIYVSTNALASALLDEFVGGRL